MGGGGNVTPFLSLASKLVARRHSVRVLANASLADRFTRAGASFTPLGGGGYFATADDVAGALGVAAVDVVVTDFMMPIPLSVAEAARDRGDVKRSAALVHTLYGRVADGTDDLVGAFLPLAALNEARASLGVPEVGAAREVLLRQDAVLVAGFAELDEPPPPPGHATYLGPLVEHAGDDAGWQPPGRPLVVVSLGTTPGLGDEPVLRRVLDACSELDVHVVATVGEHVDAAALTVPANATVTGYVRHAAVLPHADLVVTHAGLGTVTAAAAFGVPMVCVPLGREQPANAARVVDVGLGRALEPEEATVDALRTTIAAVLADASCRATAAQFAAAATRYVDDEVAVRALEALAR